MYDNIIKIYELEHIRNEIQSIESTYNDKNLFLHITLKRDNYNCPYCYNEEIKINDYVKKKITHTISITKSVYIIFRHRRFKCSFCSKTFFEKNPFISTNKNISTLTVMNILQYLKDPNHTFSSAASYHNVSVNSVIDIFDKHVDPKRKTMPNVLCIDEVHIKSKTKYPYACVLLDFETGKIVDVLRTRRKKYLRDYFDKIPYKELKNIQYVVMDLWSPYKDVMNEFVPHAKIIADAFHVVTNINRILDKKRIQVMNKYRMMDQTNLYYHNDFGYLLKIFSWMILRNQRKIKAQYYYIKRYRMNVYKKDLLNHLLSSDDELREIYNLRNVYVEFNEYASIDEAKEKLLELSKEFMNHHISEIREYGRTLYRWKNEIINSFYKVNGERYSNSKIESRNRQIKTILRNSFGYKNFWRFRARVMYSINKDVPLKL